MNITLLAEYIDYINEGVTNKLVSFFKQKYNNIKNYFSSEFKTKYDWSDTLFIMCQLALRNTTISENLTFRKSFRINNNRRLLNEAYGFEGSIDDIAEEIIDTHEGNPNRAFLILGPPGVGKSEMVYDLADKIGISRDNVKIINLSQTTRSQHTIPAVFPGSSDSFTQRIERYRVALEDAGLPESDIDKAIAKSEKRKFIPEWTAAILQQDLMAITNATSPGILFLDEIASADPDLVKFFFDVFLAKRIGQYHLPENWVVVAASNEGGTEDENTLADEDILHNSALLQRFSIMVLTPSFEGWLKWLMEKGYSVKGNTYYPGYVIVKTFFEQNKATYASYWNTKSNVRGSRSEAESQTGRSSRSWVMFMKYFSGNTIANIIERTTGQKVNPDDIQNDPVTYFGKFNSEILRKLNRAAAHELDNEVASKISEMFLKFKSIDYVSADEIINNFNKPEIRKKVEKVLTSQTTPVSLETILVQMIPELNSSKTQPKYYKNVFDFLGFLMNRIEPSPADYVKTMFVNMKGEKNNVWVSGVLEYCNKNMKKLNLKPKQLLDLRIGLDEPKVNTIKDVVASLQKIFRL